MTRQLRAVLFESKGNEERFLGDALILCTFFVLLTLAYDAGIFIAEGEIGSLYGHPTFLGMFLAFFFGTERQALVFGWLAGFAPLLSYRVVHPLLGPSNQPVAAHVAAFLQPETLGLLAGEAVLVGSVAWGIGVVVAPYWHLIPDIFPRHW